MFKLKFETDLPERINVAKSRLDREQAALLQEIGTYILQEQKFSFEEMSRGGTGADGTRWKPLTDQTELAKARKSKAFRAQRARAKKLMGQLKTATTAAKRKGLMEKIQKARAIPKSQIGVDRGLLRNSVTPGYASPDGNGGNILIVEGSRVTVGYGRSYADYFDAVRKLMPDDSNPPEAWQQGIDRIVTDWVNDILSGLEG